LHVRQYLGYLGYCYFFCHLHPDVYVSHVDERTHIFYPSTKDLRPCDLYSISLLLEEYGVYLLLQGGDHGEKLLLID